MTRDNFSDNKLSILYLIDMLYARGGTEKHLLDLASGMAERGHKVTVRSFLDKGFGSAFRDVSSIDYECLNVKRIYDFKGMMALFRLCSFMAVSRCDIIQTFHTGADLVGPIAAKLANMRTAVVSSRRDTGYTKLPRHLKAQKLLNQWVDKVLANSDAVREAVEEQEGLAHEKIEVIYNGIHAEQFANVDDARKRLFRQSHRIPAGKILIGSVGNVRPVKGYHTMVEVARALCPQYQQLHFLHAGTGEDLDELKESCHIYGIADQFSFLGKIEEVPEFLSLLDIYMQPSLSEGFSNAILEAMAAGLPVMATRVGGTKEMIDHGKNGFFVEPEDSVGMASCLETLIKDKALRHDIGHSAQCRILREFTFDRMIDRYEVAYRGLKTPKMNR